MKYMSRSLTAPERRPRPATERGRRTRSAIIDAAAAMMYQRGVTGTSLDEVLAASGTGKSQLYHYFVDKSDLVAAVVGRQLQRVLFEQPGLAHVDTWAGLDRWAAQVVAAHSRPGGPFACPLGTLAAELKNDEAFRPSLDVAFRRWQEPLAQGLRAMRDRGELAPEADPARLAAMVIAALQGGMLLARTSGDVKILNDTFDVAVGHLHSLRVPPVAPAQQ